MSNVFTARFEILVSADLGSEIWQIEGKIYDDSLQGYSASDVLIGDIVFDESVWIVYINSRNHKMSFFLFFKNNQKIVTFQKEIKAVAFLRFCKMFAIPKKNGGVIYIFNNWSDPADSFTSS